MKFELLITEDLGSGSPNIYLDTFQDESISLNFNIADISDIMNKNSSYSKTIRLPDSGRNRRAFSEIFNIESTSPSWSNSRIFDPNKKVRCYILQDTLITFEGNLQLTNIVYDGNINNNYYEAVIYADNDTLYKLIGEKYLYDLELGAYDHCWTYANIQASWDKNYTKGYYYPLIDYGFPMDLAKLKTGTNANLFYPAFYLKTLIDQIFNDAGYSYVSDFLNSEPFTNLIVPFSNKKLMAAVPASLQYDSNNVMAKAKLLNSVNISGVNYGNTDWGCITWDQEIYDPNGFFNPSTSAYKYIGTCGIVQRFTNFIQIEADNGTSAYTQDPWVSDLDDILIVMVRSKFPDGSNVPDWSSTPTYNQYINYPTIKSYGGQAFSIRNNIENGRFTVTPTFGGKYLIQGTFSSDIIDPPLRNNEEVRWFVRRIFLNQTQNPYTSVLSTIDGSSFQSELIPGTEAVLGSSIAASNFVASNIKQKDLLTSVIKMFNLFIEPTKENKNIFRIEPKDYYYLTYSLTKDWSSKLDSSKQISSEILSNTQPRTNNFSYKIDKDYYNDLYFRTNNLVFGQYRYDIDNDFLSSDRKLEVLFSPTPLIKLTGSDNIYLPQICNYNNGSATKMEGMNIRVLYRRPISTTTNDTLIINGNAQNIYPYAGYIDDPLNPDFNLNFGKVDSFYEGYTETNNNLFYKYYQNTIEQISNKDSRIIKAYLNLTSYDINNFYFSDLIYLTIQGMSGYWRINRIVDYDPSKEQTTQVELISASNYSADINYQNELGNRIAPPQNVVLVGNINTDTSNTITEINNISIGTNNYISGTNNFVSGTDNLVSGSKGLILGSNITTNSDYGLIVGASISNTDTIGDPSFIFGTNINNFATNAFIFGNNIDLSPGTNSFYEVAPNNLFVIGNNITITQSFSDTLYIGTTNIVLSENSGFNPPFLINDAISTTQSQTGQSMIKTITGYYNQNLTAGSLDIILDDYVNTDVLTNQTPIIVEAKVRLEATISGPTYECGVVSLFGVFTKNGGSFELVGSVDKVEKNNFSAADKTADLTDTLGNINLYIESSGSDLCNFYWDITFRYRYE
jgi:hypothetical protein